MKKNLLYFLLMVLLMLTLAACNNAPEDTPNPSTPENGATANSQPSNERPDFAGQTLSISVNHLNHYYLEIPIERFKAAYPGVEVVVNKYDYGAAYAQQVGTRLMAGDADDIVEADRLDNRKIWESGLLTDFNPLMQNDPNFNEEDYYMNVIDAMAYQGKLTTFPIAFAYSVVGVNNLFSGRLAEQFNSHETVGWRKMLDLYNNLEDKDERYLCCAADSLQIFYTGVCSFIDFENKTCYFNSPEFIQFLTDLKNSTSSKMSATYKFESLDYRPGLDNPGVLEEFALQYLFQPFDMFTYLDYLMFMPESQKEFFTNFKPIATDANELLILGYPTFSINEASQNKELAWELIKFLTTPEALENMLFPSMPVNREMFKAYAPSNIMYSINKYQSAGFTIDGEAADVLTQVKAILEPYNEMPMKEDQYLRIDSKFYMDDFIAFLDGVLTAEQAASAIQSKVSMYLME